MTDNPIEDVKKKFESGGNWPYQIGDHRLRHNPFAEKWPDSRLFAGYEDELHRLQENIQRNSNSFITGPFGTGKTILTKTMYTALSDVDGYWPVFVPIQKGRYGKTMAKRILDELDEPVDSTANQADLYNDVTDALERLYDEGIRTVIFYDEVINGSDGTLRQILHLQRDIENWEPVLVFNGTAHMLDEVHAKIEPLWERIDDEISLSGLDSDGAVDFVNKRLRYYCEESDWNDGQGCSHDQEGLAPFTRESIELIHQDVTPFPRHIRRQCNEIIEKAARDGQETIDFEFVRSSLAQETTRQLEQLSEEAFNTIQLVSEEGAMTANAITEALDISVYNVQEALTALEKEGLIRATDSSRGMEYKPTDQAQRELSNLQQS